MFRPGKISLEYIGGKRTRYANPFRFYLSISIVFFILYNLFTQFSAENSESGIINIQGDGSFDERDYSKTKLLTEKELDTLSFIEKSSEKIEIYIAQQHLKPELSTVQSLKKLKHANNFYNKWLFKRALAADRIVENPITFINYAIGKLPLIIFLFIPVFTLNSLVNFWQK